MAKTKPLPVIVRYEGPGKATRKGWYVSDLVAFFPTEPGDNDARTIMCYSTIGQHSSAVAGYIGRKTQPATETQIAAMMVELHAIGYKNLHVIKRASPTHAQVRREALKIK
jgi:hypothetical protein